MSEEEKAIETLKEVASDDFDTLGDDISPKMAQNIVNLIEKQQKEINFYKNEELGYIAGYEDGKRHKQTAVMIKKENAQQELFQKEIVRLKEIIEKQQKEIQRLEKDNDTLSELVIVNEDKVIKELDLISKDKIREKIREFEQVRNIIANEENQNLNYDMKRNDYCVEMLKDLLEEN